MTFIFTLLIWVTLCFAFGAQGVIVTGIFTMPTDSRWLLLPPSRTDYDTPRQRNAHTVLSFFEYTAKDGDIEWIMFADGPCEHVREHYAHIRCSELQPWMKSFQYRMPYMNALLKRARRMARGSHIMYVNMDIVLLGNVAAAVRCLEDAKPLPHIFLASYARAFMSSHDFDWQSADDRANFSELAQRAQKYPEPGYAAEFFVIDKNSPLIGRFPPLLVGRRAWDNIALQMAATHPRIAAIDATALIEPVHLHHGEEAGKEKDWRAMVAPGSVYNDKVAEDAGGHLYGNMHCMNFTATAQCQVRTRTLCKSMNHYEQDYVDKLRHWMGSDINLLE